MACGFAVLAIRIAWESFLSLLRNHCELIMDIEIDDSRNNFHNYLDKDLEDLEMGESVSNLLITDFSLAVVSARMTLLCAI